MEPRADQNKDGKVCEINFTIKQQLLEDRDVFFDQVWDVTLIMYDSIQTEGNQTVANRLNCVQDPVDPRNYVIMVDCHKQESLWNNYYSKLKAVSPSGCTKLPSSCDAASGIEYFGCCVVC